MRFLFFFLIPFIISCSLLDEEVTELPIARVGDKILLESDIVGIVPLETTLTDSSLIINNYIQGWVKDNLILQKAELNLKENQKDVKKQLEDYRNSLIIFSYEKELIKQRLDTVVNNKEIETFYAENNQNFELKDDIVKLRYLKINKKAPKLKKLRKLYKTEKKEELEKLKELAHQYAEKFHLNENQWIYFDELKQEIPFNLSQNSNFLKNNINLEIEDSLSIYFVHINDFKLKGGVSPLSFESHNIKNIIINKRKLSLVNRIREELYQEALMAKDFEIYEKTNDEK
ncbi:MAG: hypothetical protein ACPGSL_02290 [Vicingaceae bacterium]